jgi:vesicular inhibitory amino acid transporter
MFNLFGGALGLSPPQFLAIAAALMIPTVWLPNLSALSFLGVFGVAATTTVVASVSFIPLQRHVCLQCPNLASV